MPSRLLREGILDSTAVNALSFPAEVFYRRLMSVVDDFGRFDGRPAVLRGRLYSLKLDTVREAEISRWIAECEKAGLIVLYTVDAKPYILFTKLGPARAKESKYPAPPLQTGGDGPQHASVNACAHPFTDVNGCAQMKTDAPYSYSGSGSYSGAGSGVSADTDPPPDKPKNFTPPTAEEVAEYCRERNNRVDAQKFVDFYASKGWLIGKNRMKDWRAAVRTWEKSETVKPPGLPAVPVESREERVARMVAMEAAQKAAQGRPNGSV